MEVGSRPGYHFSTNKGIGFGVNNVTPVSYTHLDVYKRQMWGRTTIITGGHTTKDVGVLIGKPTGTSTIITIEGILELMGAEVGVRRTTVGLIMKKTVNGRNPGQREMK